MQISIIIILFWSLFSYNPTEKKAPKGMILVPEKEHKVAAFYLDKTPVTVKQYRKFVQETAYQTTAEIEGSAGVYNFSKQEWELKEGAYWAYPMGMEMPAAIANHPVTQISWEDAQAYCVWAKKRLPTVLEWEHAARNAKMSEQQYPWGNELVVNGKYKANCWQGVFPTMNLMSDQFRFTSPVGYYGKSPLGFADLAGNVWEWTVDATVVDNQEEKIQKGGSFMCEKSVCHGYQITGETSASARTALFHVGFRCARTID